jgi:thiol-disulfide isomerase/thioredoxin
MKKFFTFFFTAFFLLLLTSFSWAQEGKGRLIIETTEGKNFDLSKEEGKVVLLVFWTSWCTVCKVEMANIEKFYQERRDDGLEVIALNLDNKPIPKVKISYKNAVFDENTISDFKSPATLPTIYVIGKDGYVEQKLHAAWQIQIDNVRRIVNNLLK